MKRFLSADADFGDSSLEFTLILSIRSLHLGRVFEGGRWWRWDTSPFKTWLPARHSYGKHSIVLFLLYLFSVGFKWCPASCSAVISYVFESIQREYKWRKGVWLQIRSRGRMPHSPISKTSRELRMMTVFPFTVIPEVDLHHNLAAVQTKGILSGTMRE